MMTHGRSEEYKIGRGLVLSVMRWDDKTIRFEINRMDHSAPLSLAFNIPAKHEEAFRRFLATDLEALFEEEL